MVLKTIFSRIKFSRPVLILKLTIYKKMLISSVFMYEPCHFLSLCIWAYVSLCDCEYNCVYVFVCVSVCVYVCLRSCHNIVPFMRVVIARS